MLVNACNILLHSYATQQLVAQQSLEVTELQSVKQ
jgi:hypothetical protein